MDIIKKNFGQNLKIVRKSKNYTQEKLSEKIGINLRQLARIEAGESFVTSETLKKICTECEVSPFVLFDFEIVEKGSNKKRDIYKSIRNNICGISSDIEKLEFINLAISALDNKEDLSKLKYLIKGIELSLKK